MLTFYDEQHRLYHDRRHLLQMLDDAERLSIDLSPAQTLALLFHDAIYVPSAAGGANEALSAQLLRLYARDVGAVLVEQAAAIVIDTARHEASTAAAAAVLDLDLLRLAAPPEEFARQSRQLFDELHPLSAAFDETAWHVYLARRARFFERLLARPRIYVTPRVFGRFEAAARANLRAATGQRIG